MEITKKDFCHLKRISKTKTISGLKKAKKKFVGYGVQGATKTVRNRRLVAFRQRRKYTYI